MHTMHIENLKDLKTYRFNAHGGKGKIAMKFTFEDLKGVGMWSFFAYAELPKGATGGYHKHEGNDEWFMVLDGSAKIEVDGEVRKIGKGDCVLTRDGSSHAIIEVTKKLKFIAVEVNNKTKPKKFIFK